MPSGMQAIPGISPRQYGTDDDDQREILTENPGTGLLIEEL